jgi:hypothetical protein
VWSQKHHSNQLGPRLHAVQHLAGETVALWPCGYNVLLNVLTARRETWQRLHFILALNFALECNTFRAVLIKPFLRGFCGCCEVVYCSIRRNTVPGDRIDQLLDRTCRLSCAGRSAPAHGRVCGARERGRQLRRPYSSISLAESASTAR